LAFFDFISGMKSNSRSFFMQQEEWIALYAEGVMLSFTIELLPLKSGYVRRFRLDPKPPLRSDRE
jgi:hypothetical protein